MSTKKCMDKKAFSENVNTFCLTFCHIRKVEPET